MALVTQVAVIVATEGKQAVLAGVITEAAMAVAVMAAVEGE